MRLATKEEVEEIRLIAEQKLSIYKERVPSDGYREVLMTVMRGIAHDWGLEITDAPMAMLKNPAGEVKLLEIRDQTDLSYLDTLPDNSAPIHLAVLSDFRTLRDQLETLCKRGKVFSIFTTESSQVVREFAEATDEVPIFVVRDSEEAKTIVDELYRSPFHAVNKAINGEQVALRYLEGIPT